MKRLYGGVVVFRLLRRGTPRLYYTLFTILYPLLINVGVDAEGADAVGNRFQIILIDLY